MSSSEFTPNPLLRNAFMQSLLGARCPKKLKASKGDVKFAETLDGSGDQLAILAGRKNQDAKKHVMIVPGLGSSARAPNVERLAAQCERLGYHVFRMNHRGVSAGSKAARQIYHGGRSEDVIAAIKYIDSNLEDDHEITLVSLSLGSNMALKALGELGRDKEDHLVNLHIAVSPVVNLKESAAALGRVYGGFFQKLFQKPIERYCKRRHSLHPDLGEYQPTVPFSVQRFDEEYTAPQAGYRNANEYYAHATAKNVMDKTNVRTVLIYSSDDFLEPLKDFPMNENFSVIKTSYGGHIGFVSSILDGENGFWLDNTLKQILNLEQTA